VRRLTAALEGARGISNLHPAFASVLVEFDPRLHSHAGNRKPGTVVVGCAEEELPASGWWRFRCATAARTAPISTTGAPSRSHAAPRGRTALERGIRGFVRRLLDLFPYLAGLPAELATPRLAAPRRHVAAGSVAIAGSQAGVYPLASPGGWRVIGRTALRLFDPAGEPPPLLRMGDQVRFVPIEEGEC